MFDQIVSRTYRLFISRRFAITILIAISVLLFLGIMLPTLSYHQPEEMVKYSKDHPILFELGKVFNPPTLTTSWTFLILTGLLMLSTILCCVERIRNREYQDPYTTQPKYFRQKLKVTVNAEPKDIFQSSIKILRRRWWQLGPKRAKGDYLFLEGRKGAFGFWGSIVFHLGFLVILVGVTLSSSTRFTGKFLITEGQEIPLLARNLTEIGRKPAGNYELPGSSIYLGKFVADIRQERFPVEYIADIKITESGGSVMSKKILVNQAIKYRDVSMLLTNYGFAPHMVVKNSKGRTILDAYFNLKGRTAGSKDSFKVPKTKLKVETIFYPDFKSQNSLIPRAPVYAITVKNNKSRVFKGYLRRGKSVKFDGYTLDFPDLRYWAYFQIARDLGLGVIFWGFVISFIGVVVRFVIHDRQVSIRIKSVESGTELLVSGRSRYFPFVFKEELKKLAGSITGEQSGGILSWAKLKQYFSG